MIGTEFYEYFERQQQHLRSWGIVVEALGPQQFALREMPMILPPLDYAGFLREVARGSQTDMAQRIGAAAASCVSIPKELEAQKRWFHQLFDQVRIVGVDWRQFTVQKSTEQWREFLSD